MTAAEYLKERGWWKAAEGCGDEGEGELEWLDPAFESVYPLARAVAIQRARDATEERRAWARFAAARLSVSEGNPEFSGGDTCAVSPRMAADHADAMLREYRQRFIGPDEEKADAAAQVENLEAARAELQARIEELEAEVGELQSAAEVAS